ncbi:MAG: DUF3874 domain-containing protein [Bacteroidaceae bacterium]|nr:DUF3874 domain-containing protein [Bacteroidaceae bacterium]
MKIGVIRQEKATELYSSCSMETFLERVKKENKGRYISQLRDKLPSLQGSGARFVHIDRIPRICPVAEFRRTQDGSWKFKRYNGVVLVEVDNLSGLAEAEFVKQKAALLPQTFAALVGASGRSVKIWVRFSLPDGTLPATEEQASLFHAQAYRVAVQCYQPLIPFPVTLKEPSLRQGFRMTVDEAPYYHPEAAAFCLEQPVGLSDGTSFREQKLAEKNPLARMEPSYDSYHTLTVMFQAALRRALETLEHWRRGDDLTPLLAPLAEECFKSGIPEEEAVYRTMRHFNYCRDETGLRATFRNVYTEMKGFGTRPSVTREQDTALRLEEFLKRRYEIRFNRMTDDLEYRERNSIRFSFTTLDKRARNSIAIQALKEGIQAWDRDIDRFLHSDYVPAYNPVEEYLFELGEWDGRDRIRELADRVTCNHPHWRNLFYRWFLSMVAHWMGRDKQHGNATTPVLIGPQGYRKSTFCRILLPPELRFGYTDSLDFSSKRDAECYLGRFFLVNLDEFDQISVHQQAFLKHLLQKPSASLRKPYGTSIVEMRRYASFIATSNHKDLLSDLSGNRRFICVEVTAPIDTNVSVNYDQLYAQAFHAVMHGERYWLDDADEALLKESNEDFRQVSPLEHLLMSCFTTASPEAEDGEWLMAMDVFNHLQSKTKEKLALGKLTHLGRLLKKWNVPNKRWGKGSLYYLKKLSDEGNV